MNLWGIDIKKDFVYHCSMIFYSPIFHHVFPAHLCQRLLIFLKTMSFCLMFFEQFEIKSYLCSRNRQQAI